MMTDTVLLHFAHVRNNLMQNVILGLIAQG